MKQEPEKEETASEAPQQHLNEKHIGTRHVSSLTDAREYLETICGVERKRLNSKKAILAAAAEKGIVFDGLIEKG